MSVVRKKRDVNDWDRRLSWASAFFLIGSVANASLKTVIPIPDALWGLISVLVGVGILSFYFANSKEMLNRSSHIFWRSVGIFVILYLISAIMITWREEPMIGMLSGSAMLNFCWWIPSGVFACSVYNKETLYEVWVNASYIISFFCVIIFFFHIPTKEYESLAEYNMAYGFYVILPLIIQINEYKRKKRIWLLLLVLFETFTVLVYANRGVLLSLVFFLIYKFAFESNSRARKIFSILFLLFFGIIMLSSIQSIASAAVSILDVFGFESRTISMLAEGVVSDTTGRDNIWKVCFKMIEERPILGWGLGGEFYHIASVLSGTTTSAAVLVGSSPHNGVVQNFVNFGVFGGAVSTYIILLPFLRLNSVKDEFAKILIVIFGASRVIPDLVSGDGFFTEPKVAIYLYLFYFWKHCKNVKMQNNNISSRIV